MSGGHQPVDVDPFDLPDWLGGADVFWEADAGLRTGPHVPGVLRSSGEDHLVCALLAVDVAYPAPLLADDARTRAHQAWHHGQVLLVEYEQRLTLAVPGRRFDAELVMEALARFAKAVGAPPDEWAVLLRLGSSRR